MTTDLVDRLDQVRAVVGADGGAAETATDSIELAQRRQGTAERRLIRARAVTLAALWAVLAATVLGVMILASDGLNRGVISAPVAALVALAPIALADAWVSLAEIGGARARAQQAEARLDGVLDQRPAVDDAGTLELPDGVLPVTAEGIRAAWSDEQTFYIWNDAQYTPMPGHATPRYADFTFPEGGKWPDPKGMVDWLHERDIRVLLWQLPVFKVSDGQNPQHEADRAVFEQEVTTDLPAANQFLAPRLFMNNGATAAAVAFDCSGVYVETDF